jgi:transcriptional regulator with XRE-family HTH domain|tara:strand:+ start:418 stop:801 length:384 start_codon:yes stop_codon:yes gene_type:complete
MSNTDKIGDRTRKLREAKGLKQRELAALISPDLSFQNIGNLEQGKIKSSPSYINKLAKVLGVTVDYLMHGEEAAYQAEDQVHDLMATDRPTDISPSETMWLISVEAGEKLVLPANVTLQARIIRKFN